MTHRKPGKKMSGTYESSKGLLPGTSTAEVMKYARITYRAIQNRTKRIPYVRSAYFKQQKIFLTVFWSHLQQKNWRDRTRRLKLYACALDVLRYSRCAPVSVQNPNAPNETLHRFKGRSKEGERFIVQV